MRKVVFAINMTADGYFGHTDGIPDEELHRYFTGVLRNASVILCGRITYELMVPYWPEIAKSQTESSSTNEFARVYDSLEKVVFSTTLKHADDRMTRITRLQPAEEVLALSGQPGKDICVGSLRIASQLAARDLIDEYHIVVHPVLAGKGPRLFGTDHLQERLMLDFVGAKPFQSGVVALQYRKRA